MRGPVIGVSVAIVIAFGNGVSCSRQYAARTNAAASASALGAIPLDSLARSALSACPEIVIDEAVLFSDGTPTRPDTLRLALRLKTNDASQLRSKCTVVSVQNLPQLPDTTIAVNRLLRIRLYLLRQSSDSVKRFVALISPPGLASPTFVHIELLWGDGRWEIRRVTALET
jgi:hypothetical protein